MLWQRILTACILIPLVLWVLFGASNLTFEAVLLLVVLLGAWEWSHLMQLKSMVQRISFVMLVLIIVLAAQWIHFIITICIGVAFWLLSIFFLYAFAHEQRFIFTVKIPQACLGLLVLVPFCIGFLYLDTSDNAHINILLLLLSIAALDSGAYFVGRKLGKHKLAPAISPGKSIEGLIGGLISTAIVIAITCALLDYSLERTLWILLICVVTALISVLGDLFESAMKRQAGLKDSGHLLPGHGGILDRIDSYTAGVPVFALAIYLLQVTA